MEIMKIEIDICTALDDWGIDYNIDAVEKIAATWERRKRYLYNILSKHPLWREKEQAIVFNYTQTREFDLDLYQKACDDFKNNMLTYASLDDFDKILYLMTTFKNNVTGKLATQELINRLSLITKENFVVGTKCSKIFNKLMLPLFQNNPNGLVAYNHYFAALADAMNPIQIKKYTCLSIHPADFLNMSKGANWKSCHAMDGGNWQAGCLSYLLDDCSMILYTVSSNFDEEHGDFWKADKIDRQIYCFDNHYRILQSRLYPQDNEGNHAQSDDFRHLVQEILSKCLEIPNLWKKLTDDSNEHFVVDDVAALYPDWNYDGYYTNVSVPKGTDLSCVSRTIVGAAPICLTCGNEFDGADETANLYCPYCMNEIFCSECGCVIDRDNAILIDGKLYCYDCCFYCKYHEEYEPINVLCDHVADYGDICYSAFKNGDFYLCDNCGVLYHEVDMIKTAEDNYVCRDCIHYHYNYCSNCDTYHKNPDYCPNCGAEN